MLETNERARLAMEVARIRGRDTIDSLQAIPGMPPEFIALARSKTAEIDQMWAAKLLGGLDLAQLKLLAEVEALPGWRETQAIVQAIAITSTAEIAEIFGIDASFLDL